VVKFSLSLPLSLRAAIRVARGRKASKSASGCDSEITRYSNQSQGSTCCSWRKRKVLSEPQDNIFTQIPARIPQCFTLWDSHRQILWNFQLDLHRSRLNWVFLRNSFGFLSKSLVRFPPTYPSGLEQKFLLGFPPRFRTTGPFLLKIVTVSWRRTRRKSGHIQLARNPKTFLTR